MHRGQIAMHVVVVESPAKAKTIRGYLGPGYEVIATRGHVRDLPKRDGAVDPANRFAAAYTTTRGAGPALGTLRVSLHNPDDVEIVARKGSSPTFGIERTSDGERNAVIMAATVLTVDINIPV